MIQYLITCGTICWMLMAFHIQGQTTFQVVTRTIEKTIPYDAGNELNIEGEKAEIYVESWSRREVKVSVELVARHPDRETARKALDDMEFSATRHGDKLYFRNYFRPSSGLAEAVERKAVYTVTLPADCPVYLKNNFGITQVNDLENRLRIQSEFSQVRLENLRGVVGLETRFGDVTGRNIDGTVTVRARRSDLTFHDIKGTWDLFTQYGITKIFTNTAADLLRMHVEGEKADVYFFDPQPGASGYTLLAHYGNISVPQNLKFNFLENTDQLKKAVFSTRMGQSNISVKISFGDITIKHP